VCLPYLTIGLLAAFGVLIILIVVAFTVAAKVSRERGAYFDDLGAEPQTPLKTDVDAKFGTQVAASQHGLLSGLSSFFKAHGRFVARNPIIVIVASLLFAGLCSVWIYQLQIDSNPETLWVCRFPIERRI